MISHVKLNWHTRLKIVKGIESGTGFIHSEFSSHELPPGNLKSSIVLLKENYRPLLTLSQLLQLILIQSLINLQAFESLMFLILLLRICLWPRKLDDLSGRDQLSTTKTSKRDYLRPPCHTSSVFLMFQI